MREARPCLFDLGTHMKMMMDLEKDKTHGRFKPSQAREVKTYINLQTYAELEAKAKETDRDISSTLRQAIYQYLES